MYSNRPDNISGFTGGGLVGAVPSVKEPQVAHELDLLANRVDELHQQLNALENRLSPVLGNTPQNEGAEPKSPLVPLAQAIADKRMSVEAANRRIVAILNNLEI